jgi:colicin import membrane protein
MKEWRRAQTVQVAPHVGQPPEPVQRACNQALSVIWSEALSLAGQSLRAAQVGWEIERNEADALARQLGDAYDAQTAELEAARGKLKEAQDRAAKCARQAEDARRELAAAKAEAEGAAARCVEIDRRAADLRAELDLSRQDAAQARAELVAARQAHGAEVDSLRSELASVRAKADGAAENAAALLAETRQAGAALAESLRAELASATAREAFAREAHQEQIKAAAQEAANEAARLAGSVAKACEERDQARDEARREREDAGRARLEAASLRGRIEALQEQQETLLQALRAPARGAADA